MDSRFSYSIRKQLRWLGLLPKRGQLSSTSTKTESIKESICSEQGHVFIPTEQKHRGAAPRCSTLTVDYSVMQQQSKPFSFRKTFRKAFPTSDKNIQSTCALKQDSIFSSLANSDFILSS
jgi:hypothetical protein